MYLSDRDRLQAENQGYRYQLRHVIAERDDILRERNQISEENERLKQLLKAAYHLFKGADAIYDPRGDVGPTHWLETRDKWLVLAEEEG